MADCVPFKKRLVVYCGGTFDKSFSWVVDSTTVDLIGFSGEMYIKIGNRIMLTLINQTQQWADNGSTGIYLTTNNWRIYINEAQTKQLNNTSKNIIATYNLFLKNSYGEVVIKQYGFMDLIIF